MLLQGYGARRPLLLRIRTVLLRSDSAVAYGKCAGAAVVWLISMPSAGLLHGCIAVYLLPFAAVAWCLALRRIQRQLSFLG
jgi:hypothetical protein